jgi:hypothetical protein
MSVGTFLKQHSSLPRKRKIRGKLAKNESDCLQVSMTDAREHVQSEHFHFRVPQFYTSTAQKVRYKHSKNMH